MTEEEKDTLIKFVNILIGNSYPRWWEYKIEEKIDWLTKVLNILVLSELKEKERNR